MVQDLPQSRRDVPYEVKTPPKYPWRVVDARAFVYTGAIRLVLIEDIRDLDVIAISYTWSEDMKKWRDCICKPEGRTYEERIGRGSRNLSTSTPATDTDSLSIARAHLFFTIVAFLVLTRGKKFFWMDIVCIDQDKRGEKEFFVPQMGHLYRSAFETHAYPLGAEIASSVFSNQLYFPIWETRAWTVQEQILSKQVLFCYAFHGDARDDLKKAASHVADSDHEDVIDLKTPALDRYRHVSGMYVLEKMGRMITCYMEEESDGFGGNLPLSAFLHMEIETRGSWSQSGKAIGRSAKYKVMQNARKLLEEQNAPEVARISLATLGDRTATCSEDMIYSVLGVLELDDFKVTYDIGFEEARLRAFEALGPKVLAYIIGADWGSNHNSRNNDSALPRVVASSPITGILSLKPAILNCKYNRSVGTQMYCRHERLRVWKAQPDVWQGGSVVRTTFGNDGLMMMQGASVFDAPEFACDPITAIPPHLTKVIIIEMSAFGLTDEEIHAKDFGIDKIVEFVDIGMCTTVLVLPDQWELSTKTSLLTLCCERTVSGNLVNRGTALIMDASALSPAYSNIVVQ